MGHHVYFGYTTQTGNFGPNGFEVGGEYRVHHYLALAGEASFLFNRERVNDVRTPLVPGGMTNVRVATDNMNFQGGPRFFFTRLLREPRLIPFAHLLFGASREKTDIKLMADVPGVGSATQTDWSWSLGGGADFWFSRNWAVRGKIDLLKTHFRDDGQARARFTASVAYNIK